MHNGKLVMSAYIAKIAVAGGLKWLVAWSQDPDPDPGPGTWLMLVSQTAPSVAVTRLGLMYRLSQWPQDGPRVGYLYLPFAICVSTTMTAATCTNLK